MVSELIFILLDLSFELCDFSEKNTLIRLCEEPYNRTDYSNLNSYVISDNCLFIWEFPALAVYYNQSYTYKESINAYFTNKGYDMSKVWRQVEDSIRSIVVSKEYSFKYWVS